MQAPFPIQHLHPANFQNPYLFNEDFTYPTKNRTSTPAPPHPLSQTNAKGHTGKTPYLGAKVSATFSF